MHFIGNDQGMLTLFTRMGVTYLASNLWDLSRERCRSFIVPENTTAILWTLLCEMAAPTECIRILQKPKGRSM